MKIKENKLHNKLFNFILPQEQVIPSEFCPSLTFSITSQPITSIVTPQRQQPHGRNKSIPFLMEANAIVTYLLYICSYSSLWLLQGSF
jgi:hypothetical protein